ncbi:MAG: alkaline phosphatase family protein [Actinomycetota bacterium]
MSRSGTYRREPLSEDGLRTARERAQHVIVLMLENRSFDHMLGFLDHPKPEEFGGFSVSLPAPVPVDLNNPAAGTAGPTADAGPRLGLDPPHGHVSALQQMHLRRGRFQMDGFATAYGQKLAGKEQVTVVRWGRVVALSPLAGVVGGAAFYNLARLGILGGWRAFLPWLVAGAVVFAGLWGALELRAAPGVSGRTRALLLAVPAVVVALAGQGLGHWVGGEPGWVMWPLVTWAVVLAFIASTRGSMVQRARVPEGRVTAESRNVMRCMPPSQVPVLAKLAREYAVCTRWFSSVPGATWPNRNFAHAGTSDESVDIEIGFYDDPTIFELLERSFPPAQGPGLDPAWRIYYDQVPQVIAFRKLWTGWRAKNWLPLDRLVEDISRWSPSNPTMARYSFVEPCHTGAGANSQHPGNNERYGSEDFERGEALIASIYDALVANQSLFERTVFVITYDEHGGFYDHVPPPAATPPEPMAGRSPSLARNLAGWFLDYNSRPFEFSYLGPRVPAVIVSPWTEPATVSADVFDHASIPATLRRLFAPDQASLTRRDDEANDFLHLLVDRASPTAPTPTGPGMVKTEAFVAAPDPAPLVSAPVARGDAAFETQLAALEGAVQDVLAPLAAEPGGPAAPGPMAAGPVGRAVGGTGAESAVGAMALFRAAADAARRGRPST